MRTRIPGFVRAEVVAPPKGLSGGIHTWVASLTGAERACCCPAKPVVSAVVPASEGDPHAVDLLLCGHHYRVSRKALAAREALVIDMTGALVTSAYWTVA